jgi:hypothetical protein
MMNRIFGFFGLDASVVETHGENANAKMIRKERRRLSFILIVGKVVNFY